MVTGLGQYFCTSIYKIAIDVEGPLIFFNEH